MKTHNKRLYRSEENKIIFGVMGGFGEYFYIDPVLLRALYVMLCIFTAVVPGILAYILMALLIPKKSETIHTNSEYEK